MTSCCRTLLAAQACAICALTPAVAQSLDPLVALQDGVAVCSDPQVMPEDFTAALANWTVFEPNPAQLGTYSAGYSLIYSAADGQGLGDVALTDLLDLHDYLARDLEGTLDTATRDTSEGRVKYFTHESGLWLGVYAAQDDPVHTNCLFWYDGVDRNIDQHLTTRYMSIGPIKATGGVHMGVESVVLDVDNRRAPIDFDVFISDFSNLNRLVVPDNHPYHFAARTYLLVRFSAFSREDR